MGSIRIVIIQKYIEVIIETSPKIIREPTRENKPTDGSSSKFRNDQARVPIEARPLNTTTKVRQPKRWHPLRLRGLSFKLRIPSSSKHLR